MYGNIINEAFGKVTAKSLNVFITQIKCNAYAVLQISMKRLSLIFGCKKGCKSRNYLIYTLYCGERGFSKTRFWAADDCLVITPFDKIVSKFIFYYLMSQQPYIKSRVRKASIPRLSKDVIYNLEIPVPPLEVQRKIVEVLDNFSELTAELTAELEARKKQYEYYRDNLLNFSQIAPQLGKMDEIG